MVLVLVEGVGGGVWKKGVLGLGFGGFEGFGGWVLSFGFILFCFNFFFLFVIFPQKIVIFFFFFFFFF